MYHTIVVPLDGSKLAEWALPAALGIARRSGATIELLTITIDLPVLGVGAGLSTEVAEPSPERAPAAYLAEVARRIAAVYPAHLEQTVSHDFRAANGLLKHVKQVNADLIVMATHGHGPLKRVWLGSTADAVARRSRVPTLLIRPASQERVDLARESEFANILVPLDGSAASESILEHCIALGVPEKSKYTLFQAVLPILGLGAEYFPLSGPLNNEVMSLRLARSREYLEQVAERLRSRGTQVETAAQLELFAADAILDYAAAQAIDLITLTTRGHGGATRLLLGSVADKVIRAAPAPVLVYRPRSH
jgi:nucleotide-binding universal stress UspA family protein